MPLSAPPPSNVPMSYCYKKADTFCPLCVTSFMGHDMTSHKNLNRLTSLHSNMHQHVSCHLKIAPCPPPPRPKSRIILSKASQVDYLAADNLFKGPYLLLIWHHNCKDTCTIMLGTKSWRKSYFLDLIGILFSYLSIWINSKLVCMDSSQYLPDNF